MLGYSFIQNTTSGTNAVFLRSHFISLNLNMKLILSLLLFFLLSVCVTAFVDDVFGNLLNVDSPLSTILLEPFLAFGHGLGVDRISSITVGDQTVDILVEMPQAFVGDSNIERITITATDGITDDPVDDITFLLGISHNNQTIFRDYFFAANGVLYLDVETIMGTNPTIVGIQNGPLNAWQPHTDDDSIRINDSAFGASGLYTFDIAIHSIKGLSNIISNPTTHYADLSVIESLSSLQTSSDGSMVAFGTKSYFDNIQNLTYDATTGEVVIVMPFDWRETRMSHIPVVHVETHFPKEFLEFHSPGYEGYVNDIKLFKSSIVTDDYTVSDERIVHFILLQDHIRFLKNEMKKTGEPFPDTITFRLAMVDQAAFPLVAYTISEDFLVNLSWDPPEIEPNEETTFVFTIRDGKTGEPLRNSDYTFIITQNNEEIYRKSGEAKIGGQFVKFTFTENQTGPTAIKFENIRGTGQETEFGILVVPEFGSIVVMIAFAGATAVVLFVSYSYNRRMSHTVQQLSHDSNHVFFKT